MEFVAREFDPKVKKIIKLWESEENLHKKQSGITDFLLGAGGDISASEHEGSAVFSDLDDGQHITIKDFYKYLDEVSLALGCSETINANGCEGVGAKVGMDENDWFTPVPENGFIQNKCKKCGYVQSDIFKFCVNCCPHDIIEISDGWEGPRFYCYRCGLSEFDIKTLATGYFVVKKEYLKEGDR